MKTFCPFCNKETDTTQTGFCAVCLTFKSLSIFHK